VGTRNLNTYWTHKSFLAPHHSHAPPPSFPPHTRSLPPSHTPLPPSLPPTLPSPLSPYLSVVNVTIAPSNITVVEQRQQLSFQVTKEGIAVRDVRAVIFTQSSSARGEVFFFCLIEVLYTYILPVIEQAINCTCEVDQQQHLAT